MLYEIFLLYGFHAIWLEKSGRQFVYKILENRNYITRLIWYDKLIFCVRFVYLSSDKSDGINFLYV